jgi:hypothetical protein
MAVRGPFIDGFELSAKLTVTAMPITKTVNNSRTGVCFAVNFGTVRPSMIRLFPS